MGHNSEPRSHPLKKPLSSGFTVKKTLTPVEQKLSGKWTRGDVARIRLEIDSGAI